MIGAAVSPQAVVAWAVVSRCGRPVAEGMRASPGRRSRTPGRWRAGPPRRSTRARAARPARRTAPAADQEQWSAVGSGARAHRSSRAPGRPLPCPGDRRRPPTTPSSRSCPRTALLARISLLPSAATPTLLPPGDDAAVVGAPDGRCMVTTDVLVEDRHFRRAGRQAGRRPARGGAEPRGRGRDGRPADQPRGRPRDPGATCRRRGSRASRAGWRPSAVGARRGGRRR